MKSNPLPMTVVVILGIIALVCIIEDRLTANASLVQLASTAVGALASILVTNVGRHEPSDVTVVNPPSDPIPTDPQT